MPEALAIAMVLFVCAILLVIARVTTAGKTDAEETRRQLQALREWCEQRLAVARREGWSPEQQQAIASQLEQASRRLAALG